MITWNILLCIYLRLIFNKFCENFDIRSIFRRGGQNGFRSKKDHRKIEIEGYIYCLILVNFLFIKINFVFIIIN